MNYERFVCGFAVCITERVSSGGLVRDCIHSFPRHDCTVCSA